MKKNSQSFSQIHSNQQNNKEIIRLTNVAKIFHTSFGDYPALKGIDLTIEPGNLICILGKSGSGKSTLINNMAGIDYPSSGNVIINGVDLEKMSEGDISVWRGKNLGIVFQFFQLLPSLSVLENILLAMDFCETFPKSKREERARSLLRDLDIEELAEFLPNSLSTGHQQCAAIARAMANDPPIILADEPTGNLDSKTGELVIQIFKKFVSQGKTVIMVTHDRKLAQNADRILVIKDGNLIKETLSSKFFYLSEQLFSKIIEKSEVIHLKPGEMIFQSLPGTTWFGIVDKGTIEIKDDHILHSYFNRMVFQTGEIIFPADQSNYFAVTDCEVILIPNAKVLHLSDSEIQEMVAVIYPQGNFEGVSYAT